MKYLEKRSAKADCPSLPRSRLSRRRDTGTGEVTAWWCAWFRESVKMQVGPFQKYILGLYSKREVVSEKPTRLWYK